MRCSALKLFAALCAMVYLPGVCLAEEPDLLDLYQAMHDSKPAQATQKTSVRRNLKRIPILGRVGKSELGTYRYGVTLASQKGHEGSFEFIKLQAGISRLNTHPEAGVEMIMRW